jgi:hypothetical protein
LILLTLGGGIARADGPRWMPSMTPLQLRSDGQERVVGGAIATVLGVAGMIVGLGLTGSQIAGGFGCALSDHDQPCKTDGGMVGGGVAAIIGGGILTGVGIGLTVSGAKMKKRATKLQLGLSSATVHF